MNHTPDQNPLDPSRLDHVRRVEAALTAGVLFDPPSDAVRRVLSLVQPATATPVPTLLDRAAAFVARVVFDSFASPAPVGFRSAGLTAARHMTFDSDLGEVDLELSPAKPGIFRVVGQAVLSSDHDASATLRNNDGTTLGPIPLTSGRFTATITPGTWTVTLASGASTLTLPAFTMT
jgi:hypothetical protein